MGPDGKPLPARRIVALLDRPLMPADTYTVTVTGVTNVNGLPGGGGMDTLVAPVPDTAAADTAGAVKGDTARADTTRAGAANADTTTADTTHAGAAEKKPFVRLEPPDLRRRPPKR